MGAAAADVLLQDWLAGADRLVTLKDAAGRRAAQDLLSVLEEADRNLARKLRREAAIHGGMTARFTGAQAMVYRVQITGAIEYVKSRLRGLTADQSLRAIERSLRDSTKLLEGLEAQFSGIVVPTRVRAAAEMSNLTRGVQSSLLRQHLTSVDRYGEAMIGQFERYMRVGMLQGSSQDDMIAALTGHGGPRGWVSLAAKVTPAGDVIRLVEQDIPEGLFKRKRYWAERIVRTETSHAYNAAKLGGLFRDRAQMPDMQKKIMAVFDIRTAADSMFVHGQVRNLDDYFVDGAGRHYLRPPARPNDREVLVPWRPHWPDTPLSRPLTAREREEAEQDALPAGLGGFRSRVHRAARRSAIARDGANERRQSARVRAIRRLEMAAERAQARKKAR